MGLEEVRKDWTRLGAAEPLWAVCVDPTKRGGGWDDTEFLTSGRREVNAAMQRLDDLGILPRRRERALDFGCGAGRLSNALAAHFDAVTGVDISAPMLAEAQRLDRSGGRVTFWLNTEPHLAALDDNSFDLVYCDLVLQHLPPSVAAGYVHEFTRVVRPGGALVVGVPARERRTFRGLAFRYAPWPLIRVAQRVLLRYPAPMRMHTMTPEELMGLLEPGGARVVAADEYDSGDHWQHLCHFATLTAPEPAGRTDTPEDPR